MITVRSLGFALLVYAALVRTGLEAESPYISPVKKRWTRIWAPLALLFAAWLVMAQSCMQFRMSDSKALQAFRARGVEPVFGKIVVNGHTLHFVKTGNDSLPTIYFVHGTPGSWDAFETYLGDSLLLKKFRMVAIDRPGFGYSDFGEAMHLAEQSIVISPLFHHLGNAQPIFLVGHSLGGPMVVKLAADNPGVAAGLVLLAGSTDPAEEKPEKWRPILYKTPLNLLVPGALRPSNEELWYLKKDLVALKADFPRINCPVYIVHGLKDDMVPPENVDYDRKMLVNAARIDTLIFRDANHFIPWNRYTQIRDLLLSLYH